MTLKFTLSAAACAVFVAGCAEQSEPLIVDGAKSAAFENDLQACKQVSLQKQKSKGGTISGAVVGGIIGGVEGGNALEGAAVGAVLGGLLGSGEDAAELSDAQKEIVFNCMRGRGHKVVG